MTYSDYSHVFPAVRGVQAGRPCYIAMCPLRIVPTLFRFNEVDVPPELRAQRTLNIARIPEIAAYLIDNPLDYTLSCVTASIDSKVVFSPVSDSSLGANIGSLTVPMGAQILVNDGQHRRKAIEEAVKANPELGHDNIPVLFFIDEGLIRSQQMFADLNKHAVRPSDSISTLYDQRDELSEAARYIQKHVHLFSRTTESEKASISNRSTKLFTLSAIKNGTKVLLAKRPKDHFTDDERHIAALYWNEVAANMFDWQQVVQKKVATSELREYYIHSHGVMLQAMGIVGRDLLQSQEKKWKSKLVKLGTIDWARANPDWEGRAMNNGRISKALHNVTLTASYIKQKLEMPLNEKEIEAEQAFRGED